VRRERGAITKFAYPVEGHASKNEKKLGSIETEKEFRP